MNGRPLDARVPPLPKGLGTAISEAFGIPPSKRLGDLRNELEQRFQEALETLHTKPDGEGRIVVERPLRIDRGVAGGEQEGVALAQRYVEVLGEVEDEDLSQALEGRLRKVPEDFDPAR